MYGYSSHDGANIEDHTKKLLKWLLENNYIDTTESAIWEDIDVCAKK